MVSRASIGAGAVVAGLLALGVLAAIGKTDNSDQLRLLTVGEVLDRPAPMYGRTLRVEGHVARVLGATTLTLAGTRHGGELLVFGVEVVPAIDDLGDADKTPVGDYVFIEGVLRPFNAVAEDQAVGGELGRHRFVGFEGKPVLVADVVRPDRSSRFDR